MSDACDEAAALRERCDLDAYTAALRRWRGKRGLFFEYRGISMSGLGIALPNMFALFDICFRLERFCYVSIYDMELHRLMDYRADGLSWAPPSAAERGLYEPATARTYQVNRTLGNKGPLREPLIADAVRVLSKPSWRNASLIHVRTSAALRFDLTLARLDHALMRADNASLLRLRTTANRPIAGPRQPLPMGLDGRRCLFRFISEPSAAVAALIGHRAVNNRTAVSVAPATTTIQLRTGFADLEDKLLSRLRREHARTHARNGTSAVTAAAQTAEMTRWLALACPGAAARLRHAAVLTDSPPLLEHLASGDVFTFDASRLLVATRSWPLGAPAAGAAGALASFADLHVASLSRTLYLGKPSPALSHAPSRPHTHPTPSHPHPHDPLSQAIRHLVCRSPRGRCVCARRASCETPPPARRAHSLMTSSAEVTPSPSPSHPRTRTP